MTATKKEAPPNSATENSAVTRGQRRVNLLWEVTQSIIAISVSLITLIVSALLSLRYSLESASFILLSNAFFLVIGFYFGRTNHTKTGGVSEDHRGE